MGWRSFFGLGGEVPAPPAQQGLSDALIDAAYHNIRPHVQRYKAADEPDEFLPLSDPRHFARFAVQACRDVAQVVSARVRADYSRAADGDPSRQALRHLRPDAGSAGDIEAALAPCFAAFGRSLEAYAAVYANFCHLCGHAPTAAYHHGFEAAGQFGTIGRELFGPLGHIAGTVLGGLWAGRQVQAELDAAGARYDQAFASLLEAWDDACERLGTRAIDMMASYIAQLEATLTSPARNGYGQDFIAHALPYRRPEERT